MKDPIPGYQAGGRVRMADPIPGYQAGGRVGFRSRTPAPMMGGGQSGGQGGGQQIGIPTPVHDRPGTGNVDTSGVGLDHLSPQQNPVPAPVTAPPAPATTDSGDDNTMHDTGGGGDWGNLFQQRHENQNQGQGISQSAQDAGWGLLDYGSLFNIETPFGGIGLLPGQGLATAVGGALLDNQIDAIDRSFGYLDAPSGQVAITDAAGNVRHVERGSPEHNAHVARAGYVSGDSNVRAGAGSADEAAIIGGGGWGSDAHFDEIDSQFDAIQSRPSTYSHSETQSDDSGTYEQHYYDSDHDWSQPTETRTYTDSGSDDSSSGGGK